MKKNEIAATEDEMLPEYDFRGGVRGKYARDFGRNRNLRILAPDLLEVFPDSESVNEALRTLIRVTAGIPQKASAKIASEPKTKRRRGHKIAEFHSVNEINKPVQNRVYHNNSACLPGRDIPENERRLGAGGNGLCADCANLNNWGR